MFIDESERTASRLPLFIGGVVVLSLVLLTAVFRSLAVAVKAGIMNLLSIGSAYGVMALAANSTWLDGAAGHRNWWLPRWLDRLLPRFDVEGGRAPAPAPAPGGVAVTAAGPGAGVGVGRNGHDGGNGGNGHNGHDGHDGHDGHGDPGGPGEALAGTR